MKWPEVDALARNEVVIISCLSAVEQHSWHLPMGSDFIIGSEIVRRLEQSMPRDLLCLPTIWLGCSSHHLHFAGSMSARLATMLHVIRDIAASIHGHGFRKLLFVNSHGGNRAALAAAVQEVGHEFSSMDIVGVTYWELAKDDLASIRESKFGGMGHACELETSILLAVAPPLVDMSRAEVDGIPSASIYTRSDMLAAPPVAIFKAMDKITRHGGSGDPRTATAQKGEKFLDVIVAKLVDLCNDMRAGKV